MITTKDIAAVILRQVEDHLAEAVVLVDAFGGELSVPERTAHLIHSTVEIAEDIRNAYRAELLKQVGPLTMVQEQLFYRN